MATLLTSGQSRAIRPRPGSYLWLVRHDMRMGWRGFTDMFAALSPGMAWIAGLGGLLVVHLLAWPAMIWLKPKLLAPGSDAGIVVALGCVLAWIVAQGMLGVTRLLFSRGDLDLLLGAPVPATRVFAARATALAAGSFGSVAVVTLPIADVGGLIDGPAWLSAWPVLLALAMLGTACGMALGFAIFLAFGPRRGRLIAHLTSAAIAGAFVLGVQIIALMPDSMQAAIRAVLAIDGQVAPGSLLGVAIGAVRGDSGALVGLVGIGAMLFALATGVIGSMFARSNRLAAGAAFDAAHRSEGNTPIRFKGGIGRNLRRKEWRLMLRDPNLFAQIGLQLIYTIPVAIILLRSDAGIPTALAVAPTIVVIATQIAASLAWIVVSGEDAPELIAAAPVDRSRVDRDKLWAVGLPVLIIIAVPLAGLAWISPSTAALTLACAAGGCASSGLLNLWHPMPGNRRGMLRRHSQSKLLGLVEHMLAMLWAMVMVLALIGSLVALVPLVGVVGLLAMWRPAARGWRMRRPEPIAMPMSAGAAV